MRSLAALVVITLVAAGTALATQAQRQDESAVLIAAGDQAWLAGRLEEAEAAFREAGAAAPAALEPRMRLAGLQIATQRYGDGLRSYQDALSLSPDGDDLGRIYLGMGIAYLHLGQRTLAREAFNQALDRVSPQRRPDVERVIEGLDTNEAGPIPPANHP